ncbi:hypothetical protein ACTS9T_13030 [Empedobacter falsenii]|uniref:hypothetical protein n=1 Tax=Empedobacter sp. GD03797 TaxID=2975382 RepID=UPI002447F535|nr:hypothetical protein [Empedobacter sp. GD03797]MDH1881209.1 hypothetical protein [Empedobacter sp. GD03797]
MSKAVDYGIQFNVINDSGNKKNPIIINTDKSEIAQNLKEYIEFLGPELVDEMIYDINPDYVMNNVVTNYVVQGSAEEIIIISSPSAKVAFHDTNGGFINIPLLDFIDILIEWKNFLNSLPYKHTLSDR